MTVKPVYYSERHEIRVKKLLMREFIARNIKIDQSYLISLLLAVTALLLSTKGL